MKHKKLLTSVVALGTAAVMALGGTFAWQSISQTALNEGSDIVNPGGRLHNDICYTADDMTTNNDIYVENFADEDIFARVRLSEYMEIVMNYGNPDAEVVETVVGSKTPNGDSTYTAENATRQDEFEYTYAVHYFDQDNATDEYWDWTMGGADSDELYYMPTFNLNKDSLVADLNGSYTVTVGGIANYEDNYEGYTKYDADSTESGTEIYDADVNKLDEVGNDFENLDQYVADGNIKTIADVEHTAALVGTTSGFISMTEWLALKDAGEDTSNYWVYDTDGWVYWSSPIRADSATGLLLDSFTLRQVMDDTYYYAIEVEGQFVTADDVGKANSTGFYQDADEAPSENAETLLEAIGVDFGKEDTTPVLKMQDMAAYTMTSTVAYISAKSGETFRVKNTDGSAPAERYLTVSLRGGGTELEADVDYTYENGLLTITASDGAEWLNENGTALQVGANDFDTDANGVAQIVFGDDGKLTLNTDTGSAHGADITLAPLNTGVTVEDADGAAPTAVEVAYEYESDNGGYTYADGTLTITNEDYVGKVLKVCNNDDYGYGFVLVTAAASGDDTETKADGVYFQLVNGPEEAEEVKLTDGTTMFRALEWQDGYEEAVVWQVKAENWKDNAVQKDCTFTYSLEEAKLGPDKREENPALTLSDVQDGIVTITKSKYEEYPVGSFDTATGKLTMDKDWAEHTYEFTIKATGSDGSTGTIKLGHSAGIYLYTIEWEGEPGPGAEEIFTTETSGTVYEGEDEFLMAVLNFDDEGTLGNFYNFEFGFIGDYCTDIAADDSEGCITFTHAEGGDCTEQGGTYRAYLTSYPWVYADYTVICGGTKDTDNGTTETPDDDTNEETAEEIVRTDAKEEGLKVTYKRKANAVYMAGSGAVEFKLKPEYNSTVLTDTDKLTLTVNVDGEDKAAVTGSQFQTSTSDGDGWLQCTVSDLFTDKTDDVIVKLTVTYKDGDTDLTTEAYTITFTKGGTVT